MKIQYIFTALTLAFGLTTAQNTNTAAFTDCNALVEHLVQHPDEIKAFIKEAYLLEIPDDRPSDAQKAESLKNMEARIAERRSPYEEELPIQRLLPCDILAYKLQTQYAWINNLLAQQDKWEHAQTERDRLFKKQLELLAQVDHTNALSLLPDSTMIPVSSEEAISANELVDLLSEHYIRGLTCIHSSLNTFERPIMNAPYAQGMLQTVMSVLLSTAHQRWLVYNLTREQWSTLLERQYQAFAYIVPPVCTIFTCFSSQQ